MKKSIVFIIGIMLLGNVFASSVTQDNPPKNNQQKKLFIHKHKKPSKDTNKKTKGSERDFGQEVKDDNIIEN